MGVPATRSALQGLGQRVQVERGPLWMTDRIATKVQDQGVVVVDSIRHRASVERLREIFGSRVHVVFISAPEIARIDRFIARGDGDDETFRAAAAHPVEAETERLWEDADVVVSNRGPLLEAAGTLAALTELWVTGSLPITIRLALATVEDFHRKHGFEIRDGTPATLRSRLTLVMEELGELARWTTRGEGDISEEHADILILMLGNAVAMGLDLEQALIEKCRRILARRPRVIHGETRVSHWQKTEAPSPTRLDRYRLTELPQEPEETRGSTSQLPLLFPRP
jgi:NTP pyrophosphatase (non-canonical NTP hydrolase)